MLQFLPLMKLLARAEPAALAEWLRQTPPRGLLGALCLAITGGCAAYGFSIGLWRAPQQGLFVAVKMPCLIFLTILINGLLNGMLAALLGSGLSFRQTLRSCLMSFALFGLIVGSLSPIAIAMTLDAPPPGAPEATRWYRMLLLTHTAIIALAGFISNHKLLGMLRVFAGSREAAWRVLIAWLAGNLFVGAQLSYNLRPFFGNPDLPIQFVRPDPFDGSFYESVWSIVSGSLREASLNTGSLLQVAVMIALIVFLIGRRIRALKASLPKVDNP